MLKYIIATILVLAIWVLWALFAPESFGLMYPLAATGVIVAFLVALWVLRKLRARRAARELERALEAQAAEQARGSSRDLQDEMMQMQQEFQRAIEALKGSKLSRGGANALYELPWQVIIGPPGSGKSTALRNSGLQFPYMSSSGGGVRGIGGTRNCDWWLTNESVILDTAGRWTTEEEDRQEWLGFLDLLKKHRPEKPLNGVIATVSLSEIGGGHEEDVSMVATRIRERVDEIQSTLQVSLPVYVLFTKADLIPGFVETFGDLSKEDRGQVWGYTMPIGTPPPDVAQHFSDEFQGLLDIQERRSLSRMSDERKVETRELIHGFSQQLAVVEKNCRQFISELFATTAFGPSPMMRGCYITSGTQEGRPIDRVMHKMAEAFGIRGDLDLGSEVKEAKSYFLRDVFLNVIFADQDLAMRSQAAIAAETRQRYYIAAAVALLTLICITLPAFAWNNNRVLINETESMVDEIAGLLQPDRPLSPQELSALTDRVQLLKRFGPDEQTELMYTFGLYQNDVYPAVRNFYELALRERVMRPIVQSMENQLDRYGREYAMLGVTRSSSNGAMYDALKEYLLMSYTRAEEDETPSMADEEQLRQWLRERLTSQWVDLLGGDANVTEATQRAMQKPLELYIDLMIARRNAAESENPPTDDEEPRLRFVRDLDVVTKARRALTAVNQLTVALDRIKNMFPDSSAVSLNDLVGEVSPMSVNRVVHGAFTRQAWEGESSGSSVAVRELLSTPDSQLFGDAWVLGREAQQAEDAQRRRAEQLCQLRNEYFNAYVGEWSNFLNSIMVRTTVTNEDTLADLQSLTRGSPEPYRLLFRQVQYNATLAEEEAGEGNGEVNAAAEQSLMRRFWARVRRIRGGQVVEQILSGRSADGEQDEQTCVDLGSDHVYRRLEGFIQFGAAPPQPPPAEGAEPPPTPQLDIASYEAQLAAVRDALQTHLNTPAGTDDALQTALQTALTTTQSLVMAQEEGWRPSFRNLLRPPIAGTVNSTSSTSASGTGNTWCTQVYTPYHRNIEDNYPLNPGGHDIPLSDFSAFYGREGTLWSYYGDNLQRNVPHVADNYRFAQRLDQQASRAFRPDLLEYLQRAHDITSVFFPPGADGPTVQYDVRIRPSVRIATQTFCAGGQCQEYHNGPEQWIRFTWPGESPVDGASLEVRGVNGIHERIEQGGEWGLFRLLEAGTITSTSNGNRVFTMTWRLRTHQIDVSIDVRPVRGDAPFFGVLGRQSNPPLLQPLRATQVDPPREIVLGRSVCNVR